jgi:hypothetical protein
MANVMMAIRLAMEPVRTLAFGSISGTYMGIGLPLNNPARIMLFQNLTDQTLMFSLDGVNDNFPLAAMTSFVLDVTSNKSLGEGYFVAEGTRIYVRDLGIATTLGAVYVTVMYASD